MAGNPVANIGVFVESDTAIEILAQVVQERVLLSVPVEEITAGTYRGSYIRFGTGGVCIFAGREDLVRLMVALSEHLDALDRSDAADRKIAEASTE